MESESPAMQLETLLAALDEATRKAELRLADPARGGPRRLLVEFLLASCCLREELEPTTPELERAMQAVEGTVEPWLTARGLADVRRELLVGSRAQTAVQLTAPAEARLARRNRAAALARELRSTLLAECGHVA